MQRAGNDQQDHPFEENDGRIITIDDDVQKSIKPNALMKNSEKLNYGGAKKVLPLKEETNSSTKMPKKPTRQVIISAEDLENDKERAQFLRV